MTLRWGIASSGKISHDFACALSTLPETDHQVAAIAARSVESAQKFAKLHSIPKAYGSYEALAKDPSIDVVYIGAVNTAHLEIALLMLNHGKHILCEKPLCMNEKQAKKLLETAKSKKRFCMEAVWSRFFPAYQYVKRLIENGDLGEVKQVEINFGFKLTGIERIDSKELGGGTILDLGVYTIQAALWAFKCAPVDVKAEGTLNNDGVDVDVQSVLKFKNGTARMHTSALEELDGVYTIHGSKGTVKVKDFWCPTALIDIDGKEKVWPLPDSRIKTNYKNSVGLRYEAEEVRRCIRNGLTESPDMMHDESLKIVKVQDKLRGIVGVKYPQDELKY